MKLFEINWSPTTTQLRQFGVACAFVFPFLGWLGNVDEGITMIMGGTGMAIAALSFVFPQIVKFLFVGFSLALAPIGMVTGELAMMLLFLGVFLPIGLFFRLIGRDALQRSIHRERISYWQTRNEVEKVSNYYRRY